MNILVTGAMGFIGSNLCIKLLNDGHKVTAFDNLLNSSIDPSTRIKSAVGKNWINFKFYNVDIRLIDTMSTIVKYEAPQAIVHLAALGSVPRSFAEPIKVIDTNEKGFACVLQMALNLGIKKVVYASSSSVYGNSSEPVRTEGEEGEPLSPYAISKIQNELFAKVWGSVGLEMIGLRFFNVYGPGQRIDSEYAAVIPKFINTKKPIVFGNGKTTRDFTFVDDVCEAIDLAIKCKHNNFVCNIGTGVGTSLDTLLDLLGKKSDAVYERERKGDVQTSIANCKRAKTLLGFEAKTTLAEGLRKTTEYYKAQYETKKENEKR